MESKGRPGLLWTLVSQLLGLAWLAPIIALLVLNFQGYIAGSSIDCGVRHCNHFGVPQSPQKLNTDDHDILGVLQLVAKALEVWFIFLAGCLVYDLTMLLARRGDGLPMRYLTTPSEFTEIRGFFDRSLWTSVNPSTSHSKTQGTVPSSPQSRTRRLTLIGFILFVAAICIICNLMGPATAVLLLPTLGWRVRPIAQTQAFAGMASAEPPANLGFESDCTTSDLAAGQYSCTAFPMQESLDRVLTNVGQSPNSDLDNQDGLSFSFNFSYYAGLPLLVPNRQALLALYWDALESNFVLYTNYSSAVAFMDYETSLLAKSVAAPFAPGNFSVSTYNALQNAQQITRLRQGPGFLFQAQCYENVTVIEISDDKVVRCYNMPNPDPSDLYENDYGGYPYPITTILEDGQPASTMCIRVGSAWVGHSAHTTFSIGLYSNELINVDVYSSDRAIYLTSTTYHCSANKVTTGAVPCDWDALFSAEPAPDIKNTTINPSVTEYSLSGKPTIWCRYFAFLRILTYALPENQVSYPLELVNFEDNGPLGSSDEPLFIHPDWTLAVWSVEKGETVPSDRSSAQDVAYFILEEGYDGFTEHHTIISAQSLSMIYYTMKDIDAVGSPPTPATPVFQVGLSVYVWSYGLGSRTSKLGVVVAIIGCVIVLMKIVVAVWARTVGRDMLDFVTLALKQEPPRIFEGLEAKEAGRVRFWMDNEEEAKFIFDQKVK